MESAREQTGLRNPDRQAEASYAVDQLLEIRLKCGFSACNADSLQKPGALFQKSQDILRVKGILPRTVHQISVVAEWTAEIAAPQKNRGGHMARIVEKSRFL